MKTLLVKGMDARVKCERLRSGAKKFNPLSTKLSKAIERYEKKTIGWRNSISHSWPSMHEGRIYFGTHVTGPVSEDNPPAGQKNISPDELMLEAMWINGALLPLLAAAVDNHNEGKPFAAPREGEQE